MIFEIRLLTTWDIGQKNLESQSVLLQNGLMSVPANIMTGKSVTAKIMSTMLQSLEISG